MDVWVSKEERKFLLSKCDLKDTVFSHNDLLANNVLLLEPEKEDSKITFIDFEYSGYNVRGFDLGNYFAEAIMDYDYPEYPFFK